MRFSGFEFLFYFILFYFICFRGVRAGTPDWWTSTHPRTSQAGDTVGNPEDIALGKNSIIDVGALPNYYVFATIVAKFLENRRHHFFFNP